MSLQNFIGSQEVGTSKAHNVGMKPLLWGFVGGAALLSIYFLVLTLANSLSHALEQFYSMWYWVTLLTLGFGIQVGLYAHIRKTLKLRAGVGSATSSVAAAGGISSTSMVACCMHHVTDVLPILGLSVAVVFLNKFQTLFIVTGVLSNFVGLNIILKVIQDHGLYNKQANGFFSKLMRVNMKKSLYFSVLFGIVIFIVLLLNSL